MNEVTHCDEITAELQVGRVSQLTVNPYDRILELAIETKDLDKLKQFMDLKERHEANEARKAYHESMAAFKSNPPKISKDKTVSYQAGGKTTSYKHASLSNVTEQISSSLSKHGLSAAWTTVQSDGNITVTCTITHILGHSESTSLSASPDNSGSKNSIQAIGSTISYLERYTILAITGLSTFDQDDDGKSSGGVEHITVDQQTEISDMVSEIYDPKPEIFWNYMKVESASQILAKDYNKAITALKKARERKAAK